MSTNRKSNVSIKALLMAFFAALLLVGSLTLVGCGGGGESSEAPAEEEKEAEPTRTPEEAAEGYVQAVFDSDGDTLWALLPPDLRDALMDEMGGDEDEVISELESTIGDSMDSALSGMEDYVNGFTVTATDTKDLSSSEIDDLIETYSSDYNLDLNIEEAQEVDLTVGLDLTSEGEELLAANDVDPSEATTEATVVVIKVDGEWYFDMTSLL